MDGSLISSREDAITKKDRRMERLLKAAPWLSFFIVSLPLPLIFVVLYILATATETAAIFLLLALSSLAIGSIAGLIVALVLFLYRRHWLKGFRERMAADGITAGELQWFMSELTSAERKALKSIEQQNPLLADAYRETLASRLTATRVVAKSKRELLLLEKRLNRVAYIQGTDTTSLQRELREDRERFQRIQQEGKTRRAEAEARLQMIEAAATRGATLADTNFALQRLEATNQQLPYALESARLEQEALEEVEREMREGNQR
ncbi:MAG TPA: hypothetical protein VGB17_12135 [Pyrinomonadaceae bacterium]